MTCHRLSGSLCVSVLFAVAATGGASCKKKAKSGQVAKEKRTKSARRILTKAKDYMKAAKLQTARLALDFIVRSFPGTAEAREAMELIEELAILEDVRQGEAGSSRETCPGVGADGRPASCQGTRIPGGTMARGNAAERMNKRKKYVAGLCLATAMQDAISQTTKKRALLLSIALYNMSQSYFGLGCKQRGCDALQKAYFWRRQSRIPKVVGTHCKLFKKHACSGTLECCSNGRNTCR